MPQATVVEIDFNFVHSNGKQCTKFVIQGDPYEGRPKGPRTVLFWPGYGDKLIAKLHDLKLGDRIWYNVDDSKWQNITDLGKLETENNPGSAGGYSASTTNTRPGQVNSEDKSKSIARAVAVKAGVDIVSSMLQSGNGKFIKKTIETELIGDVVLKLAKQLEPYLMIEDDNPVATETAQEPTGGDFSQEGFGTGEDAPF